MMRGHAFIPVCKVCCAPICEVAFLHDLLEYDPFSGGLTWRYRPAHMFVTERHHRTWNTRFAGRSALHYANGDGYYYGKIKSKGYAAHRVAFAMYHCRWPSGQIDHINGDRRDNRIVNLRDVAHRENGKNQKIGSNNKSGWLGIYWHEKCGKWRVQIAVDGKNKYLGSFADLEQAINCRQQAERTYGFHPNHGRPPIQLPAPQSAGSHVTAGVSRTTPRPSGDTKSNIVSHGDAHAAPQKISPDSLTISRFGKGQA